MRLVFCISTSLTRGKTYYQGGEDGSGHWGPITDDMMGMLGEILRRTISDGTVIARGKVTTSWNAGEPPSTRVVLSMVHPSTDLAYETLHSVPEEEKVIDFLSAFPVVTLGEPVQVTVDAIVEYEYGAEAVIIGST
jgi:hypothetical protein